MFNFIKSMAVALLGGLALQAAASGAVDVFSHPTLKTGLLAWYSFAGNFDDASGTLHAKPANGTPRFGLDRCGTNNGAFQSSGGNALSVSNLLIGTGSFSIQFWALNPTNWFLGQGIRSDHQGMHIGVDASGMRCDYWGNSLSAPLSESSGWSHWVITHEGATGSKTIWRDGQCVARATTTPYSGQGIFFIGRHFSGGGYFTGCLDDLAFWNRALSAAEIAALYAGGQGLVFKLQ